MPKHTNKKLNIVLLLLIIFLYQTANAEEVTIQAVGDIMLGGIWKNQVAADGYFHPFDKITKELRAGDITIANLEAPLTSGGTEFKNKKFRFKTNPLAAKALKKAGITTVTLANNHIMDFGADGLQDTLTHLDNAGIAHAGAGENLTAARKPVIYNIRNIKIAILGYSLTLPQEFWAGEKKAGTAPLIEKQVKEDIAAARKQADIVIVTVHWGEEGTTRLRPYQPRLAKIMIDAGADAVIGHHPHILQGVEKYKNGIIFYSLGNFAFASKSRIADRTLLIRLRFNGNQRTAEMIPVNILHSETGFQPTLCTDKQAEELVKRLKSLSPATIEPYYKNGKITVNF